MADQIFAVESGFFNSINEDRLYSAEQMNMPYKRLVANGVFATPQGTPSSDLQATSANDGMNILVAPGNALIGDKWFYNPATITITVPGNTGLVNRVDSVIAQMDKRTSGRVGNIVYRQGDESGNAPSINTDSDVAEFRLANVAVAPGATSISGSAITDMRGSADCPWVTSLIEQVDTSTLWNQFNAAYQEHIAECQSLNRFFTQAYQNQFEGYTEQYQEYTNIQRQAWEDFMEHLTQELDVSMNVMTLTSSYTAADSVTNIPINIATFDPTTDILMVYINGLLADGKYTLNQNYTSIDLINPIAEGNSVYFVVLKSVVTGQVSSFQTIIQQIENALADLTDDTDWVELSLASGVTAYDEYTVPAIRRKADRVYIRGAVKGATAGSAIAAIPAGYVPDMLRTYASVAIDGTSVTASAAIQIDTTGNLTLAAVSGTVASTDMIALDTEFILG